MLLRLYIMLSLFIATVHLVAEYEHRKYHEQPDSRANAGRLVCELHK